MTKVITPDLATVIREAINEALLRARVEIPARVERFDPTRGTVDVQPLIKDLVVVEGETEPRSLPVITAVPVAYLRWNGFVLRCPVAVGDIVSLRFCDRDIETWLSGAGEEVTPKSRRGHALDDAVAVPGPRPWQQAIAGLADGALVLGREDGSGEVRIEQDGSARIGPASGPHPRAAREGDATLVDATTDAAFTQLLAALHTFMSAMAAIPPAPAAPFNAPATAFLATVPSPVSSVTGRVNEGSDNVGVG